jgi:hypothetical protein
MLFQNVTGDAVRLREMILSIPQHMSNSHQFPENSSFKESSHLQLPQTGRDKKWLKPDSMVSNFVYTGTKSSKMIDICYCIWQCCRSSKVYISIGIQEATGSGSSRRFNSHFVHSFIICFLYVIYSKDVQVPYTVIQFR